MADSDDNDLLLRWRSDMLSDGNRSLRTVNAYIGDVRLLISGLERAETRRPRMECRDEPDLCRGSCLSEIGRDDLQQLVRTRERAGDKPTTIVRRFAALRAWYRFLDQQGIVRNEAVLGFRPLLKVIHAANQMSRIPSDTETEIVQRNVARLSDDPWMACRDGAVLALMASCGLRLPEVVGLDADALQRSDRLCIRGSDGTVRFVEIPERVADLLDEYRRACPFALEGGAPLFRGARGGRLNPGILQRQLRRLRGRLGLPRTVTPMAFRLWFAKMLASQGEDWTRIRDHLGYARTTTARRALQAKAARSSSDLADAEAPGAPIGTEADAYLPCKKIKQPGHGGES